MDMPNDRAIAEGFARGHRWLFNPNSVVLVAAIARADIAFAETKCNEAELVLFASPKQLLLQKNATAAESSWHHLHTVCKAGFASFATARQPTFQAGEIDEIPCSRKYAGRN